MDVNQLEEFNVLCRAQSFLDLNGEALAAINRAPARAELDGLITSIEAEAAEQHRAGAAAESQTILKNEVHARLRRELGRVRTLAEARPQLMPNMQKFKPLSRNTSDLALRAIATGVANGAREYEAVFAREGFGEDFVDNLRALVAEFCAIVSLRISSQQRRFLAARNIEVSLKQAWKMISLLSALFEPDNAEHRRIQASWKEQTLHAPRALPKPADLPRIEAGADVQTRALPAGDAPAAGTAIVPVPPPTAPPAHRRILRVVARLLGKDEAA